MGRHKKYDIDEVLDKGVRLLRRQGYHNTSLDDILSVSGMPKGSFYSSFTSKEDFGVRVLNRYVEDTVSLMTKHLEDATEASPLQRLRNFYEDVIAYFVEEGCGFGCLLNDLSLELAGYNDTFRDAVREGHTRFIDTLAEGMDAAQERGEVRDFLPARELAFYVHTNFDGAIVKMKGARDRYPLDLFLTTTFDLIAA